MIMEAERFHNLLSVSWRPRRAGGVLQSDSDGLRTKGAIGVSPSQSTGREGGPAQAVRL